jgi:transcriptional regulator with XRE-family HTH domain
MDIGVLLCQLRKEKGLSQSQVEERCGLSCCYMSRVEQGHTIPGLKTLERWAEALDIDLYRLFRAAWELPALPKREPGTSLDDRARKLGRIILRLPPRDHRLLWSLAREMARVGARKRPADAAHVGRV